MTGILQTFVTVMTFVVLVHTRQSCDSFLNVSIIVKESRVSANETKQVNGCIQDRNDVIIYVRMQNIKKMGRDSVRNMKNLETISFWGNPELREVAPFSFWNVPKLKSLQIAYSPQLKEIPKGVFNLIPELQELRIHNNQIGIIENEAFANLAKLKKLIADDNNLEYWNREWFEETTNLEIMDFQANKIRTIPRKAFEKMQKLRQIFLDFNEIATIQPQAFIGLTNLDYLGLRNNRLKELNADIFPNELKIRTLLISANYLNFLSNEVLTQIAVKDIIMDYNPWKCSCLDRINYWIYTTNATLRKADNCNDGDIPVCAVPKVYSQTCLEYVDQELTERYLNRLRKLSKSLGEGCARLD